MSVSLCCSWKNKILSFPSGSFCLFNMCQCVLTCTVAVLSGNEFSLEKVFVCVCVWCVCVHFCELWGLSIDFYYFYTDQTISFLSPNPKLPLTENLFALLHFTIFDNFFPSWGPQADPHNVKNFRFYYPCGDIWCVYCTQTYVLVCIVCIWLYTSTNVCVCVCVCVCVRERERERESYNRIFTFTINKLLLALC